MGFLWLGSAAFLLFYAYEIPSATGRFAVFRLGFAAGCLLLLGATAGLIVQALHTLTHSIPWMLGFGIVTLLFLALLLYTLFFALPFTATYRAPSHGTGQSDDRKPAASSPVAVTSDAAKRPVVCRTGVYALCRHPGVLWFIGFYLFLWLTFGTWQLLAAAGLFSVWNILYIILQDRWSFPRMFADYADYRTMTPFLLPTMRSMRECLRSF